MSNQYSSKYIDDELSEFFGIGHERQELVDHLEKIKIFNQHIISEFNERKEQLTKLQNQLNIFKTSDFIEFKFGEQFKKLVIPSDEIQLIKLIKQEYSNRILSIFCHDFPKCIVKSFNIQKENQKFIIQIRFPSFEKQQQIDKQLKTKQEIFQNEHKLNKLDLTNCEQISREFDENQKKIFENWKDLSQILNEIQKKIDQKNSKIQTKISETLNDINKKLEKLDYRPSKFSDQFNRPFQLDEIFDSKIENQIKEINTFLDQWDKELETIIEASCKNHQLNKLDEKQQNQNAIENILQQIKNQFSQIEQYQKELILDGFFAKLDKQEIVYFKQKMNGETFKSQKNEIKVENQRKMVINIQENENESFGLIIQKGSENYFLRLNEVVGNNLFHKDDKSFKQISCHSLNLLQKKISVEQFIKLVLLMENVDLSNIQESLLSNAFLNQIKNLQFQVPQNFECYFKKFSLDNESIEQIQFAQLFEYNKEKELIFDFQLQKEIKFYINKECDNLNASDYIALIIQENNKKQLEQCNKYKFFEYVYQFTKKKNKRVFYFEDEIEELIKDIDELIMIYDKLVSEIKSINFSQCPKIVEIINNVKIIEIEQLKNELESNKFNEYQFYVVQKGNDYQFFIKIQLGKSIQIFINISTIDSLNQLTQQFEQQQINFQLTPKIAYQLKESDIKFNQIDKIESIFLHNIHLNNIAINKLQVVLIFYLNYPLNYQQIMKELEEINDNQVIQFEEQKEQEENIGSKQIEQQHYLQKIEQPESQIKLDKNKSLLQKKEEKKQNFENKNESNINEEDELKNSSESEDGQISQENQNLLAQKLQKKQIQKNEKVIF